MELFPVFPFWPSMRATPRGRCVRCIGKIKLTEKNVVLGTTFPTANISTTILTQNEQGSNPNLRDEGPEIKRLRH